MTITKRLDFEIFFVIAAVAAFATYFVMQTTQKSHAVQLTTPIIAGTDTQSVPTETNPILKVDTASQPTPDGTKEVIMKTTHNSNGTLSYDVTTLDKASGTEQSIYTASGSATEQLSIPFNAWSPDDKYLFLLKGDGSALVFTATGEDIILGEKYLDVKTLFNTGARANSYRETTGWASETLLIVNSTAPDGSKGSSYWFEVPTKTIIALSSQF